jgi:hypothetical protein
MSSTSYRVLRWTWSLSCIAAMVLFVTFGWISGNVAFALVMYGGVMIAVAALWLPDVVVGLMQIDRTSGARR